MKFNKSNGTNEQEIYLMKKALNENIDDIAANADAIDTLDGIVDDVVDDVEAIEDELTAINSYIYDYNAKKVVFAVPAGTKNIQITIPDTWKYLNIRNGGIIASTSNVYVTHNDDGSFSIINPQTHTVEVSGSNHVLTIAKASYETSMNTYARVVYIEVFSAVPEEIEWTVTPVDPDQVS